MHNKYAYVTLVMKNDNYIAGALVLAHSIRRSGSKCSLVCMITSDVSRQAVKALKLLFDFVWTVPYIRYRCVPFRTQRQRELYAEWIEESFTKWNCIDARKFGRFEKVMFIDADMMIMRNCDTQLFCLEPPAMTFSLPWAQPYADYGIRNPYGQLTHGRQVDCNCVLSEGFKSFVGIGSLVLVSRHSLINNFNFINSLLFFIILYYSLCNS